MEDWGNAFRNVREFQFSKWQGSPSASLVPTSWQVLSGVCYYCIFKISTMPRWRRWSQRKSGLTSAKPSSIRRWSSKMERDQKIEAWPRLMTVTRKCVYSYLSKSLHNTSSHTGWKYISCYGCKIWFAATRQAQKLSCLVVFSNMLGMIPHDYLQNFVWR